MVPRNKAIIDAAYAAVAEFTALVTPGLAKSTAVKVLLTFLAMPEKKIFNINSSTTEWYDLAEEDEDYNQDLKASNGMKQVNILIIIVLVYSFFKKT